MIDENSDIALGKEFRSEPVQLLLHGVPGAGKSQTLKWIRKFFEEVCNFKHERDFVFVASQNTMAALIEGVTLHSYGDVPYYGDDGKRKNARKKSKQPDISNLFLRYEHLRWIFIDEVSTAGTGLLAHFENNVRRFTRDHNTWKWRSQSSERRWGGVNVVYCGDFWQFRPVKATSIIDRAGEC